MSCVGVKYRCTQYGNECGTTVYGLFDTLVQYQAPELSSTLRRCHRHLMNNICFEKRKEK